MKVWNVEKGEKFVLSDRGGVWEKIGTGICDKDGKGSIVSAKCIFGEPHVFGTTISIDPNAYCYVHRTFIPISQTLSVQKTRIVIVDDFSGEVVKKILNPSDSQLSALSSADTIRFTPDGSKEPVVFHVSEFAYDVDKNEFLLLVIHDCGQDCGYNESIDSKNGGKDGDQDNQKAE